MDSASAPLGEGLINAFEGLHPDSPFSLVQDSRESLLISVQTGDLEAAIILGPPSDRALFAIPIALELIVVITEPSNSIESISLDSLRSALTGHIANWSSLGGSNTPIIVMTSPEGSSTRLYIENVLLQTENITSAARMVADERSLTQLVATTSGSLGYLPFSSLTPEVKPLAVDGTPPSLSMVRQESYPLLAQIVFISREEPQDFMRSFLDWIASADGQQVVRRHMLGYND